MRVRDLPPLRHTVEVESPTGRRYRWADDEPDPSNVPAGITHSSTMPGGFETSEMTLPRKTGIDYGDLQRFSTIRVRDAACDIVSEARLERTPRVSGDQMSISPAAVGWQAHLEDDKSVRMLVIDRDLTRWGGLSRARRAGLNPNRNPVTDGQATPDASTGVPAIKLEISGTIPGSLGGVSEATYDAGGGCRIAALIFDVDTKDISATMQLTAQSADIDTWAGTTETFVADLATGPATVALATYPVTTPRQWVMLQLLYPNAYSADENERWAMIQHLAVIGDTGIPIIGDTAGEEGVLASDVVAYALSNWAPGLTVTDESIAAAAFPIPQLAFLDSTTVGEIVRQSTRFELQDWAVWENKTFWMHDRGARGRKWRARVGPAKLEETGPQVDRLWESVVVRYGDVDGSTRTVGPTGSGADVESDLLHDPDPENPANQLDFPRRDLLVMGTATPAAAIEVGRRFLQEQKLLDTSGRARLVGHVEDDRGILHPYSHVRAGDQIMFVDAADPSYRRIVRVGHTHADRSCAVDLDAPPEGLAALLERLGVTLAPLGL